MARHRRHARRLSGRIGGVRIAVGVGVALALVLGGTAYGAYRYDGAAAGRLLPGVKIAGVDVGEMTRAEAIAAVRRAASGTLDRRITVRADGRRWRVTPAELGTKAVVAPVVDRALSLGDRYSWASRVFYRIANRDVGASYDLTYRQNDDRIERFVGGIARQVEVDPRNAAVSFEDGELVLSRPREGQELLVNRSRKALARAMLGDRESVRFGLRSLEPEVTDDDLGHTIVVRLSELKLYLYDGAELVKTYPVAAGTSEYPTPQGTWTIWDKRENPTWVNPAPDGWGAEMPAVIPGGPGNPLGTRALYLDAPGIRIHGTSDTGSIGTFASHGCVRMRREHVEELYEIVPIGTQVIVTQ
ncbi:MAG TPA: L,D-transpeptidase/peptidoglycan binding protein [Actinomycetota bacterium]|nr:L,D-transpeptidase/peptidoglycan binding protein [Actinomycetota bacterium]